MEELAASEAMALVKIVSLKSVPTKLTSEPDRTNSWTQFGQSLIDKCRNAINWMNAKHECLHNPTAPSIHSSVHTLDNSAIQSTIRSVFVSRLIASSSPDCAEAVFTSLFPPLLNHISILLSHLLQTETSLISPRLESYLCYLLHIFDSILICSDSHLSPSSYQPLVATFYQQLLQYISQACLYHSSSCRSASLSAEPSRLASQMELYSHLLVNCKDLIFRSPFLLSRPVSPLFCLSLSPQLFQDPICGIPLLALDRSHSRVFDPSCHPELAYW
jgi:hypothetical protein